MNKLSNIFLSFLLIVLCVFVHQTNLAQQSTRLPMDSRQDNFMSAYKYILQKSDNNFKDGKTPVDENLFPLCGESSVYIVTSGDNVGDYIIPHVYEESDLNIFADTITDYQWKNSEHLAIYFKREEKKIAIFNSQNIEDGKTVTWEAPDFKSLFATYLFDDIIYYINEEEILTGGLSSNTEILIIPSFIYDDKGFPSSIDKIFDEFDNNKKLSSKIYAFLENGGKIYTEGNAAYFIDRLGFLPNEGNIDFSKTISSEKKGMMKVKVRDPNHPLSFPGIHLEELYAPQIPFATVGEKQSIISTKDNDAPLIFYLNGASGSGNIVCNLGTTTNQGLAQIHDGSRQLQWTMNSLIFLMTSKIDVFRNIENDISKNLKDVQLNSISYDGLDTFLVHLNVRNLTHNDISKVEITEKINDYFTLLAVGSELQYNKKGNSIEIYSFPMDPNEEISFTYQVRTPRSEDPIHEKIDDFLVNDNALSVSKTTLTYSDTVDNTVITRNEAFVEPMFGARIFADTDINWKNFLGLDYQPFKVFMKMENKNRTSAMNTKYIQYIPKDVPFYWVNHGLNIPILKTPGGKFVDLLKGSNSEDNPAYDMDSDGHPDAWLDTASIYPKGYTIVEDSVYWANPWNHLSGGTGVVFEDLDHDGLVAQDTDGDGIADIEEPGDKLSVYKVTWDMGEIEAKTYYDPYCYYELWVDPPEIVDLAAGVGYVYDKVNNPVENMFYPYTPDINNADKADNSWEHWMERDDKGDIIWKQLIKQRINNYEGFAFIDTLKEDYHLTPFDSCLGTVPQPRREFIAVLSLGGEDIDMYNPAPKSSMYSRLEYETIHGEKRTAPIRTTYTYYAPLPNPLQFEYLTNSVTIDTKDGNLPKNGEAGITFHINASTEYSYYWIRNVGYDVDYHDLSDSIDGVEPYGDGVFGYFIFEIPKGFGGYSMSLPKKADGEYDLDSIIRIDGDPFTKWIDNPNTANQVEIWEDPFNYQVYVPQILIPPALDDDNHDGVDDWFDDRGDRFCSETGFLHDEFMPGNGEDYKEYPSGSFIDDIYGKVDSGWYAGPDGEYGDDFFEKLGTTHLTIHANYKGDGKEGPTELSKGGYLVVEEIFGGSPWVIFSHGLSGQAQGAELKYSTIANPTAVKYGEDTTYIKHTITDKDEPHEFDAEFAPYHMSKGYTDMNVTVLAGTKDPCSLIEPDINMPAILDPDVDNQSITLIPMAAGANETIAGYPKNEEGTFIEIKVEVSNLSDFNWLDCSVIPIISEKLGSTEITMEYVAYPRPLVPDDDFGTFTTGWRFNQPDGEMLVELGHEMNMLQSMRSAYFVFLLKIDPSLENGIYDVPFTIGGNAKTYDGEDYGSIEYKIPNAKFCIVNKNADGSIKEYEKLIIQNPELKNIVSYLTDAFEPTGKVNYSFSDINILDIDTSKNTLNSSLSGNTNTIDLSSVTFPDTLDEATLYIYEQGIVNSQDAGNELRISDKQEFTYYDENAEKDSVLSRSKLYVEPRGARIYISHMLYKVNDSIANDSSLLQLSGSGEIKLTTAVIAKNAGNNVANNTKASVYIEPFYSILEDTLYSIDGNFVNIDFGEILPGARDTVFVQLKLKSEEEMAAYEDDKEKSVLTVISLSNISYESHVEKELKSKHEFTDNDSLLIDAYDFSIDSMQIESLGENQVRVTANIRNNGIKAGNIWVRIYPVIGDGLLEFPFAEVKIEEFKQGGSVTVDGTYTIPETFKSIDFVAIVDDGKDIQELHEGNNKEEKAFKAQEEAGIVDEIKQQITVFPNPCKDFLKLKYNLNTELEYLQLSILDLSGKTIKIINHLPLTTGGNVVYVNMNNLPEGNYIYRIAGKSTSNNFIIKSGKITKSE